MKTVRRLLYREIITAVAFVAVGFLALFMFFDLVDELQSVARHASQGYQLQQALLYIALKTPEHLYQLLPLSVLIGCIFVMARLAQSSEYTILRTGGLDPLRALGTLLQLGLALVALTFVIGDYVAPWADRQAIQIKAIYQGHLTLGQTGAWLKENQGERHFAVNVRSFDGIEHMRNVRIHEFNENGQLLGITTAEQAEILNGAWQLQQVQQKTMQIEPRSGKLQYELLPMAAQTWRTGISADMVAAALLSPERMRTWELFKYMRHLFSNKQNSQRYEVEFWRKVFYPLSCLVMLVLALPFAYLHFRTGQIAGHVFIGVLAGISFSLLNNVFNFIGVLQNWEPWLTSAAPSLIYSAISLAAFWWMVLRR
ncbi:LPS export ABC transporter permease LptG [Limnohabitans sp. Jir72]|uniref:LPS export ABC transporter permease LptG n=1 Tax=Limnohabitans sp. Jir72 TaxID=1977909 RepID=UPI000D3343BD|nr:LPS export ABC transporter permease LptG [Limnohabitans sp. Jir72]PUE35786.1 LPS export ABC transporter permease LptG [Limnohabitans sp. Jir72]